MFQLSAWINSGLRGVSGSFKAALHVAIYYSKHMQVSIDRDCSRGSSQEAQEFAPEILAASLEKLTNEFFNSIIARRRVDSWDE